MLQQKNGEWKKFKKKIFREKEGTLQKLALELLV